MVTTQSADAGTDAARMATLSAAAIGAAMALLALALFSGRAALSVAAGAIIAVANLVLLSAIIRAVLRPAAEEAEVAAAGPITEPTADGLEAPPDHAAEGKRGGAAWGAFALVKIVVLFGGIWLLLTRGMVDPIPLGIGYGVLPLGITFSGLFTSLSPRARGRGPRTRLE